MLDQISTQASLTVFIFYMLKEIFQGDTSDFTGDSPICSGAGDMVSMGWVSASGQGDETWSALG